VQDELERAVASLTGQHVRIAGAGRTDAGVHALGQVVSFRWTARIPVERIPPAMNSVLPGDIRAVRAEAVHPQFHARFSAVSRRYAYLILNREAPSALLRRYAWHFRPALNVEAMQAAAAQLIGVHDFAAWANSVAEASTTVRRVIECAVRKRGPLILTVVEANAFLHGMVRNIVGTLVEVGIGKRRAEDFETITRSRDRRLAGPTAPAHGLCLVRVRY